ncbi:MAG: AGE family epimerase/isomerase [Bacteroidales bacterium]|nr:AGE family epimerase/isomerase [Bacteroidales bacterium]
MTFRKSNLPVLIVILTQTVLTACGTSSSSGDHPVHVPPDQTLLADKLEKSLFEYIIDPWYPLIIDTLNGGYISEFEHDWTMSENSQLKALVQQARHVWATSYIYEHYPERKEFLDYAAHGFRFLRDAMWDKEFGGFHTFCSNDGTPDAENINDKRIYGQAFAIYGLSQYYRMSKDQKVLQLAKRAFLWMEEHAHDPAHGGYFEMLNRNGTPLYADDVLVNGPDGFPTKGLKDYNSSIHLMEAFSELYRVWPDSLVRARLEEMFYLIRDTFVHPHGYLQLYFYPDWKLVTAQTMNELSEENYRFTSHFTYGHDVETAYLLLETTHVLGWSEDEKTQKIAKRLVDHSLESGWDQMAGGFYDAGIVSEGKIMIISNHKAWWGQVEGMNALLMMHQLYHEDPNDYYGRFLKSWKYINNYLIDKEYGGWFNYGLDTYPESKKQHKSHIWKTTYHNSRGMIRCIQMLRGENEY